MVNAVTDPLTGSRMDYGDLIKDPKPGETWTTSMVNQSGRLSQEVVEQIPTGSDTVNFISKDEFPKVKFATYALTVCKKLPQKAEIY